MSIFSIYHFFEQLTRNRPQLVGFEALSSFPFDTRLLSSQNGAIFPDLSIKISRDRTLFTGGELVELKDSQSYQISSFNSTIPTGKKTISRVVTTQTGTLARQMLAAGDDIFSLPERDVFYLVRGRDQGRQETKVCLIHGSFFETVKVEDLLQQAFSQMLEERLAAGQLELTDEVKAALLALFADQQTFSRVRDVEQAAVKIRFRVMTEAKAEGNILNPHRYPAIGGNTLNLIIPCHDSSEEELHLERFWAVFDRSVFPDVKPFKIRHLLNGDYLVFQLPLV